MGLQVLLIDDDIMINLIHRKIIGSFFRDSEIAVFNNGKEALNYLKDNENVNFLIFLDLNMPIMDGWVFLKEINQHFNTNFIQVVVVSSSIDKVDREIAMSYNFVLEYISKPLQKEYLLSVQNQLVGQYPIH